MKVGIQFKPGDWSRLSEDIRLSEELGYHRVYMVDGQLLWRDLYVYMTLALQSTNSISVASAVTNPYTRHFTVTANAHATLAELFPGRVVLGMGRGDNAVRTLGLEPVVTDKYIDVVRSIRELVHGGTVAVGERTIRNVWEPRERVPLMMAATGPRNLRLAGQLADIVIIQVGANPEACGWAVQHIREGAQSVGRDADEIEVVAHCAVCVSSDLEAARRETRWIAELVGIHSAAVARHAKDHRMPASLMKLAELELGTYDYESHLDATIERQKYPDDVIEEVALIGSAEQVSQRIRALEEVGVTEIAPAYLNDSDQIRIIGEQVIPLVR